MNQDLQDQLGRPMALDEAWQVSASRVGWPLTAAGLVTLPHTARELLTEKKLLQAIDTLLDLYPLLRCSIVDGRTVRPSWRVQPELSAGDVLRVVEDSIASDEELIADLVNSGTSFDGTNGPLWRVVWYQGTRQRIGLSIAHVLTDGLGARNLFCDLLRLLRGTPLDSAVPLSEKSQLAPPWEVTVAHRFNLFVFIRFMTALLLFKLWHLLHPTPWFFPKGFTDRSPTKVAILRLTAAEVSAMKSFGKLNGIGKLHPVLMSSVVAAAFLSTKVPLEEGLVGADTPFAFRSAAEGHPRATGNYSSSYRAEVLVCRRDPFVDLCKRYGRLLVGYIARQHALDGVRLLGLVPAADSTKDSFVLDGVRYPCVGTDRFLLDMAAERGRTMNDIAMSNLMVAERTGWEEDEGGLEMVAAQSAGAAFAPLLVTVITIPGGDMTLSVSWQVNTLERGAYAERLVGHLRRILAQVCAGEVDERTTVDSLRQSKDQ